MKPIRIQLKRTKGWRMPSNTVKVTRPGKWGNPFKVGDIDERTRGQIGSTETAVALFQKQLDWNTRSDISELRGKNLACWCKIGSPCHADVLLELANKP